MSAMAFATYLEFPQWKSDLLCYEIATIINRKDTSEILLARLGAVLSSVCKDLLREEQCKLKRFVQNATHDFEIDRSRDLEVVRFIGSPARLQQPAVPADSNATVLLQQLSASESGKECDASTMHDEIATILSQRDDKTLLISQLGARMRPQSRQWLRNAHTKLQAFLEQHCDRYVVDATVGSENVTMISACEMPGRKLSTGSLASRTSICSLTSDCASTVSTLLSYEPNLVALLVASAPAFYED